MTKQFNIRWNIASMTGRKTRALQVPPVVPHKALEKFSKALYGAKGGTLQCMRFPSCHDGQPSTYFQTEVYRLITIWLYLARRIAIALWIMRLWRLWLLYLTDRPVNQNDTINTVHSRKNCSTHYWSLAVLKTLWNKKSWCRDVQLNITSLWLALDHITQNKIRFNLVKKFWSDKQPQLLHRL